ncbi:MAG: ubiquinol-cytochrome C chaperone family protein [Sphingomicrobium sp.]
MLNFLFPRLTPAAERGAEAFKAVTAIARRPAFFRQCAVPDTIDGRFSVLATVLAMMLVRIEQDGASGDPLSVAVTERFIAAMEAEHREFGLGDPTLGKTVRKLVGVLARRVDQWRLALSNGGDWTEAIRTSLYQNDPDPGAVTCAEAELRTVWSMFANADLTQIAKGELG